MILIYCSEFNGAFASCKWPNRLNRNYSHKNEQNFDVYFFGDLEGLRLNDLLLLLLEDLETLLLFFPAGDRERDEE